MKVMRTVCFILIFFGLGIGGCSQDDSSNSFEIGQLPNPAGSGARYPFLTQSSDGEGVLMSWLEGDSENASLWWSAFNGVSWSTPELIRVSESFFINWADFPSIAAMGDTPVAAHWLQKVQGSTYAYHVNMAFRSVSGNWSEPVTPHADQSPSEHGFADMISIDENRVFAIWLDGYQAEAGKPMTLHSALVSRDGIIEDETEVDGSVCDCCQTSLARSGDNIIAVYRNRTEDEIRDIYRVVYDLQSGKWGSPLAISDDHWEIAGCPVNGPQVAAHDETVIVTWFTAAGNQPRSYMVFSRDGGLNFSPAVRLDSNETVGRVGVTFDGKGTALLTWVESGTEHSTVVGRYWRDAMLGGPFKIGEIQSSRVSGFPRAAATGSDFIVAWTDADNESIAGIKSVLLTPSAP